MKFKTLLLFIIVFNSCSKKSEFIKGFNCDVETFSNLERIEDVKNLFSVYRFLKIRFRFARFFEKMIMEWIFIAIRVDFCYYLVPPPTPTIRALNTRSRIPLRIVRTYTDSSKTNKELHKHISGVRWGSRPVYSVSLQ